MMKMALLTTLLALTSPLPLAAEPSVPADFTEVSSLIPDAQIHWRTLAVITLLVVRWMAIRPINAIYSKTRLMRW